MIGLLSIYYKMPYQFPNVITFEVDPATLNSYQGEYTSTELPINITIRIEKGEMIVQPTGQNTFSVNPISENVFVFDPASVKLTFEGKNMTLKQGGSEYLFTKL